MNKIKKILLLLLISVVLTTSFSVTADAKNKTVYATQTVTARGQTGVYKFNVNTKFNLQFKGKKTSVVERGGERFVIKANCLHSQRSPKKWKGRKLRRSGVLRWKGYKFTWYSQRVLPGRGLKIPGRHVDKQGFVCDKDGYIVVGSSVSNKRKMVIVPTPFGKYGKTYDCGYVGSKHFDCYVAW